MRYEISQGAAKLGISKRTLQRKLSEEKTSFQKQLNGTRELLARHYLRSTDMSSNDIAFLLGYQEINLLCTTCRAFILQQGVKMHIHELYPDVISEDLNHEYKIVI